jgi:CRP/FNR family transcriptional regulator, nitrogen oxide reductase regulator
MYFKQADILAGLDKTFIAKMMEVGVKTAYEEGTILFKQGDAAHRFYILVKGRVRLIFGDNQNSAYTVDHGGEAFGWSSLIGSDHYTAAARCVALSTLIAFEHDKMEALLGGDPANAVRFYKNLTLTLGNRLLRISSQLADQLAVADNISYGTGQVQEPIEII